ncbi:MAG: hypothetical protein U9R08_05460 [Nanoarchaeota archaeon]|nr:hypothetical protein [Nanoarchaeota archaeon]
MKGQVSIQFNWIFVLIAGAVILLFFAGIVIKQKGVSETKFCGTVLNSLDATFSIVSESSGTEKTTDMPKQVIELDCREYRCLGTENIPAKSTGNLPLFGPGELEGMTAIISSKEWDVPFRIVNFLYVTTQEVRYYIVYRDSSSETFANYVYDKMPDNVTKELVSFDQILSISNKNDNKVRFIFVDVTGQANLPNFFDLYSDEDVTVLEIDSSIRSLKFYDRIGQDFILAGISYYINDVDMLGAIFSDNLNNFECALRKAYQRLNYITTINLYRIDEISNIVDQTSSCPFIYAGVYDELEELKSASLDCIDTVNDVCAMDIYSSIIDLRTYNNDLIKESCPLLY